MKEYELYFKNIKKSTDPNLQIPGKALVLGMCPDGEIQQRGEIEQQSVSPFEIDYLNSNFNVFAIKAYQRSAADKVMNDPNTVRSPQILLKTVEYLRDCIVDLDRLSDSKSPYKGGVQPTFQ